MPAIPPKFRFAFSYLSVLVVGFLAHWTFGRVSALGGLLSFHPVAFVPHSRMEVQGPTKRTTVPVHPELFRPWSQVRYGSLFFATPEELRAMYCDRHFGVYENEGEPVSEIHFQEKTIRCAS